MHNSILPSFCLMHIHDAGMKLNIIKNCDTAFRESVVKRSNFVQLFEKIHAGADFIVAYDQNILGYIALYANNCYTKQAYITQIAVKPEFQNMHIGGYLLECGEFVAKSKGMELIKLEVYVDNKNAIRFYERHGFKQCSMQEVNSSENGTASFYMQKFIKDNEICQNDFE